MKPGNDQPRFTIRALLTIIAVCAVILEAAGSYAEDCGWCSWLVPFVCLMFYCASI